MMLKTFKHLCQKLVHGNMKKPIILNVENKMNTLHAHHHVDNEAERIVWMDLEMTGLDVNKDHILEIACIVTDSKLNIVAEAPTLVINQPVEVLNNMGEWCTKQHSKTGLTQESKKSKITLQEAESIILDFFHLYLQPGISPLAGSSVYMDKLFLLKYLPKVTDYMHYRIIDVSSIKELCRRWNPDVYCNVPKKQFLHRSLNDIKESIDELKWYKENFIKNTV